MNLTKILHFSAKALVLNNKINYWMRVMATGVWETAVKDIIQADNFFVNDATIQAPRDYFRPCQWIVKALTNLLKTISISLSTTDRDVPVALSLCSTNAVWCTSSLEENEKCEVIRAGGITTGVYPLIECKEPSPNVVSCLADVSAGRADMTAIDSNFGFLARQWVHPIKESREFHSQNYFYCP